MTTLKTPITDTAIKRHAADPEVRQLTDPRHPLRLRYRADRERGTFYLVQNEGGRTRWRKLGQWPGVTAKALLGELPGIIAKAARDAEASVVVSGWQTTGELLNWYGNRVANDRNLSDDRRHDVASALRCHLLPLLGAVAIDDLTAPVLDERFFQPLQRDYKLSSVKSWFQVLKSAFAAAVRLGHLPADPLNKITFATLTTAKIEPKPGKLRPMMLPHLVEQIRAGQLADQLLVLMLLLFGSRIGETRQAKWMHIGFDHWHLPAANTKTRAEHNLPITEHLQALFSSWAAVAGSVWLFPAGKGRCLNKQEAATAVKRISGGEWTAHDLRKLARTRWAEQGTDYLIGELLLNHALNNLDKTYILTHANTQQREALTMYHGWLFDQGLEGVVGEIIARLNEKRTQPKAARRVA